MTIQHYVKFFFGLGMSALLFLMLSISVSYAQTADIKINGSDGPVTVPKNEPYVITWGATNVANCFISPFISGGFSYSGSFVNTSRSDRTFKFLCTTSGGASVQDEVELRIGDSFSSPPPPSYTPPAPSGFFVNLSVSPSTITRGQNSIISWSSQGMTSCIGSGGLNGWVGSKTLLGSLTVFPESSATYTLTCSNGSQSITRSAAITVQGNPAPPAASSIVLDIRGRNSTLNQNDFSSPIDAQGLDNLRFEIRIKNNGPTVDQARISVLLPQELFFVPVSTYVDGVSVSDGIQNGGVLLGSLAQGQERVVIFDAVVYYGVSSGILSPRAKFSYQGIEVIDDVSVEITPRGMVLGAADVTTGPANVGLWILVISFGAAILIYLAAYVYRRQLYVVRVGSQLAFTKALLRIKEKKYEL